MIETIAVLLVVMWLRGMLTSGSGVSRSIAPA